MVTAWQRSLRAAQLLRQTDANVWTSHEALLLDYEEALIRREPDGEGWYASSGHLLWIGERTRNLDGAHVEFVRGVTNPVAVKLGPQATPEEVVDLCGRLNPLRIPGRLTLIPRLGFTRVSTVLPGLIRAVQASHHPVVWACDPMHGNLVRTRSGHKTRLLAHILLEVAAWIDVHRAEGSWPGGLHLEITAEDVAECRDLGELEDSEVDGVYTSLCDPRLNPRQSLELVTRVAALLPQATTTRRTGIAP